MRNLAAIALCPALALGAGCKKPTQDNAEDTEAPSKVDTSRSGGTTRLDLSGDLLPSGAVARLGSRRMLDRSLERLVFSPDGEFVVSNGEDGYVVWHAKSGKVSRRIEYRDATWPIAFSPDGKVMAGGTLQSGRVQLWDFASGQPGIKLEGHTREIRGLCFLGPNQIVSGSDDGSVRIWNANSGELIRTLSGAWKEVNTVACSRAGTFVAWGTEDGGVYVHDSGKKDDKIFNLGSAKERINAVNLSMDGRWVAAGGESTALRVWKTAEPGSPIEVAAHDHSVQSVEFSPDGSRVYSAGGDRFFRAWRPETGKLLLDLPGIDRLKDPQLMTLAPDGKSFASWSKYARGRGTEGGRWWLWNSENGQPIAEPKRHSDTVGAIAYSPDGTMLATGSNDREIRLWEASSGKLIKELGELGGRVRTLRFSADGNNILASGEFAKLVAIDVARGGRTVKTEPIGGEVVSFDISPDGKTLVTGDEIGRVWTIDLASGRKLKNHDREAFSAITSVAFAPGGKSIAIAGRDRAVLIIDVKSGDDLARLEPGDVVSNFAIAFSADGKMMASAGDDHTVRLWTTSPWKEVRTLSGHDGSVRAIDFRSDGKQLVSGGNDSTVSVWDTGNGELLHTFKGHVGAVAAVAFAPDGKSIASGSQDQTALIWRP